MSRFTRFAVSLAFGGASVFTSAATLAQAMTPTTVPTKGYRDKLFATLEINHVDLGLFTVDTGSSLTTISHATQEKLNLPKIATRRMTTFKGTLIEPLVVASDVQLGPLHLQEQPVVVCDCAVDTLPDGLKTAGGIGMDILGRQPFSMDFRAAKLTFYDPRHFTPPPGDGFQLLHGMATPYAQALIEGHDGWFEIDSGFSDFMMLSGAFVEMNSDLVAARPQMRLGPKWGENADEYYLMLRSATIFGEQIPSFIAPYDASNRFRKAGLLGAPNFRDKVLTIDPQHDVGWLEKCPAQDTDEFVERLRHDPSGGLFEQPPLNAAIALKRDDAVRQLVERGEPIDETDDMQVTPLMVAASRGNVEFVDLLLAHHASANAKCKYNGITPLFLAAQYDRFEVAKRLLDAGADVDAATDSGRTPLFMAAEAGYSDLVQLFLDHRAKVDQKLETGETALLAASANGNKDIVKMLLTAGADARASGPRGTCLTYAAQVASVDCVKLLLEHGADPNKKAERGSTPLMTAAGINSPEALEIVRLLVAAGADPKLRAAPGLLAPTAFDIAAERGTEKTVQLLHDSMKSATTRAAQ
jgi:ankyrin repeat protein